MIKIGEILRNYEIKPVRYEKCGKTYIIDSNDSRYVLKETKRDRQIYEYLKSRNFHYFPNIINDINDDYEITEFQRQVEMPLEQKVYDMMELVSLLHLKTSYYKEVDDLEYKKIYEDLLNNIEYLYSYYFDTISLIESKVYMSPSEFLLAKNINIIFETLSKLNYEIKEWYKLVENKSKIRYAVLHNNLEPDHFIKNDNSYLISWDKAKIDMPIFDIYKFYIKNDGYDIEEILRVYEKNYPLLEEERVLLFILIMMPSLLEKSKIEYNNVKEVSDLLYKVRKTYNFLPKASKDTK